MKESATGGSAATASRLADYYQWVEPDSDITVCLKFETIDRLQHDVLRGFDSVSVGDEVGGILLGRTEVDRARTLTFVDDFVPIPCLQRSGPFYALTAEDSQRVDAACREHARYGLSAVGYYRSHNRQGLFLSADDLRLIERHFRAPDNVFLLIKTMPNRGCTAGFFFRKDGCVRGEFTDSEAPLIPISIGSPDAVVEIDDTLLVAPAPSQPVPARRPAKPVPDTPEHRGHLVHTVGFAGAGLSVALAAFLYWEARTPKSIPKSIHGPDGSAVELATASAPSPLPPVTPAAKVPPPQAPAPQTPQPSPVPVAKASGSSPPIESAPPKESAPSPSPIARVEPPDLALNSASPAPALIPITTQITPPIAPPAPPITAPVEESTVAPKAAAEPPKVAASAPVFIGPQVIHQVAPAVPRGVGPMITTDVQVDVDVKIDDTGRVTATRVASMKGSAAGLLTIEALKAAQLFRFQPARENGRPVASSMVLTFRFARPAR